MKQTSFPLANKLRIITAILRKDIGDAIKNRVILSIFIGVILVMLNVEALPFLLRMRIEPQAVLYVERESAIAALIDRSPEVSADVVKTLPGFQDALTSSGVPLLGISIPEGFDHAVEAGEPITLQCVYAHWVKPEQRSTLEMYFETELSKYLNTPVEITPSNTDFFPSETAGGHLWMVTIGFVTITFLMGGFIVPVLLTDEKESKTLDALLVSPAGYSEVVIGKAAAGLIYCILGLSGFLFLESRFIATVWLAVLAILLSSLTGVSIGLVIGSMSENPTTTNLWAGVLLMVLLAPVILIFVFPSGFPPPWDATLERSPSIAMVRIIRFAMEGELDPWRLLQACGTLIGWSVVLLGATTWRVRREKV